MGNLYVKTATLTASEDWELPAGLDLSHLQNMTLIVALTDAGSQALNKLDIKLQQRWQDLNWIDRIAVTQFDGAQAAAREQYTIQANIPLDPSEQGVLAALSEGTYRNGPFPPVIYDVQPNPGGQVGVKSPVSNCRLQMSVTDGGTPNPSFTVTVVLLGSGPYSFPG